MNIQLLNNSGQSIQTLLITALVLLVLTGGLWWCMEEVNQFRNWSQRPRPPPRDRTTTRPTYNVAVRIWMVVWLISSRALHVGSYDQGMVVYPGQ